MKVEETFISATALRGAEDPDTILLCENWIDRENFMSVQLKRPYRHRYEARLPELLRSPRKLPFFEPIRPRPIAVFGERRISPTISNGKSACVYHSGRLKRCVVFHCGEITFRNSEEKTPRRKGALLTSVPERGRNPLRAHVTSEDEIRN